MGNSMSEVMHTCCSDLKLCRAFSERRTHGSISASSLNALLAFLLGIAQQTADQGKQKHAAKKATISTGEDEANPIALAAHMLQNDGTGRQLPKRPLYHVPAGDEISAPPLSIIVSAYEMQWWRCSYLFSLRLDSFT